MEVNFALKLGTGRGIMFYRTYVLVKDKKGGFMCRTYHNKVYQKYSWRTCYEIL